MMIRAYSNWLSKKTQQASLLKKVGENMDVGIEILPMKSLQSEMSSGVSYYEGEFYNVIRQGRGVPAVPLIILGIAL